MEIVQIDAQEFLRRYQTIKEITEWFGEVVGEARALSKINRDTPNLTSPLAFGDNIIVFPSIDKAYNIGPSQTNIDNLIPSNAQEVNQKQKEINELMRLNKGMRKRSDGRYEWRKTVAGVRYSQIETRLYLQRRSRASKKKSKNSLTARHRTS